MRKLTLILIVIGIALAIIGIITALRVRAAVSPSTQPTPTPPPPNSFILQTSLPGSIYPNGRAVLNSSQFVFQLLPGSTGDYAVMVNSGSVSTLPDNYPIMYDVDFSNITGVSYVSPYIVFGGGEEAPNPWSPCAAPCAPYRAFYNTQTGKLTIIKLQGGSCDNANFIGAVPGNNGDIIAFGGADIGSTTGSSTYEIYNSSLQPYLFGTISFTDDAGHTLRMYRKPVAYYNGNVYFVAAEQNGTQAYLETISVSQLYQAATSNIGVLCGGTGNVTLHYVMTLANDWNNTTGVQALYVNGSNYYFLYWNGTQVNLSINGNITPLVTSPNPPFLAISPQGQVFVGVQNGNSFTAYQFNLNGGMVKQKTFSGQGFIDMFGNVVVFSGLSAGSTINIYPLSSW